jgi:hypothetical protein
MSIVNEAPGLKQKIFSPEWQPNMSAIAPHSLGKILLRKQPNKFTPNLTLRESF